MAYIEANDCLTKITAQELIRLFADKTLPTDPEPDEVDPDLFGAAAAQASAEMDGYLRRRYGALPLPLAQLSVDLRERVVTMTLYHGYERRGVIPEARRTAYTDAIKWLRELAEGKVDPGLEPPPPPTTARPLRITGEERQFTTAKLRGL